MKLNIKKLIVKKDARGWLAEVISQEDVDKKKFGLVLITTARPGQVKGNHYHKKKKEWYCVIKGRGLLRIWGENTNEKKELEIGERNMVLVEIPTGYFHSIQALGNQEMYLMAYVSEAFNPSSPDTYYE